MQFGKRTMFLFLNGAVLLLLLLYFLFWAIAGNTTEGKIVRPYQATKITIEYSVEGKTYTESYMRNGVPFTKTKVSIRYLQFSPSYSHINSFMGFLAEPLAWWMVLLVGSAMLLLTNNTVFSKGTIFRLHKGFPWISMDEYFPAEGEQQNYGYNREGKRKYGASKKLLRMDQQSDDKHLP